jgi:hypothetical protein
MSTSMLVLLLSTRQLATSFSEVLPHLILLLSHTRIVVPKIATVLVCATMESANVLEDFQVTLVRSSIAPTIARPLVNASMVLALALPTVEEMIVPLGPAHKIAETMDLAPMVSALASLAGLVLSANNPFASKIAVDEEFVPHQDLALVAKDLEDMNA